MHNNAQQKTVFYTNLLCGQLKIYLCFPKEVLQNNFIYSFKLKSNTGALFTTHMSKKKKKNTVAENVLT